MDEQCVPGGPACNRCQCINDLYLIQEDSNSGDQRYSIILGSPQVPHSLQCHDSANPYGHIAAVDRLIHQVAINNHVITSNLSLKAKAAKVLISQDHIMPRDFCDQIRYLKQSVNMFHLA